MRPQRQHAALDVGDERARVQEPDGEEGEHERPDAAAGVEDGEAQNEKERPLEEEGDGFRPEPFEPLEEPAHRGLHRLQHEVEGQDHDCEPGHAGITGGADAEAEGDGEKAQDALEPEQPSDQALGLRAVAADGEGGRVGHPEVGQDPEEADEGERRAVFPEGRGAEEARGQESEEEEEDVRSFADRGEERVAGEGARGGRRRLGRQAPCSLRSRASRPRLILRHRSGAADSSSFCRAVAVMGRCWQARFTQDIGSGDRRC